MNGERKKHERDYVTGLRLVEDTLTVCRFVWKRFRVTIRINRSIDPIIIRLALGTAAVAAAAVVVTVRCRGERC